jgi:hypothetical protein
MNTRYAPGGDIYIQLSASYGTSVADRVYRAALSEEPGAIAEALAQARHGNALNESTAAIFLDQIVTDPLAAPLEAANRQIGRAIWNVIKNPFVLAVVVIAAGFYFWPMIRPFVSRTTTK